MLIVNTDEFKAIVIKHSGFFTSLFGLAAAVVNASLLLADFNRYWLSAFSFSTIVLLSFILYIYLIKCRDFRHLHNRLIKVLDIFSKTHNTWHIYKRLADHIQLGNELPESRILRDILKLGGNFAHSLTNLHPDNHFTVSIKMIKYKNIKSLDNETPQTYSQEPFELVDLEEFRDIHENPRRPGSIITGLDFDAQTNPAQFTRQLKETLFYRSFISKTVEYVSCFSPVQQELTNEYKSGLVAPVILMEVPFALICVGSKGTDIFTEDDRELACTFADAISEFIRMHTIIGSMEDSKKIVLMSDDDYPNMLNELERLCSQSLEGTHNRSTDDEVQKTD